MRLTFLGATRTVTGSKYWLSIGQKNYLVDCGLFQGPDELEQRNWDHLSVNPKEINAVILTHAHIDHSGYLPRLVKNGFEGPVYASDATCALLELLLPDSGHLQEEEAYFANKKGYSRHKPALPLYTHDQAVHALKFLRPVKINQPFSLDEQLHITMRSAGHILGSTFLECDLSDANKKFRLVFSGDLGRYDPEILEVMRPPTSVTHADYLLVESTYGDREHPHASVEDQLSTIVTQAVERGGALLIPSFAIGRSQQMLYYLRELQEQNRIPDIPVYLDSPMGVDATQAYTRFGNDPNLKPDLFKRGNGSLLRCKHTYFTRSAEESKQLNEMSDPMIIVAASGMCDGGRIVHHLKYRLPDPRTTVLFVGFQGKGTRGQLLRDGADEVHIHGETVPVRAHIESIEGLSAHGDYHELLQWLSGFEQAPKQTFIVHGEPVANDALKAKIEQQFHWPSVRAPEYLNSVQL
ncbi:MBL fold metallo-hydrolase [Candidatus Acetothermia bacterium]|nr:MBL fold metallo-hydrolase [Candidatus Acetothermia bacterium]